MSVYLLHLEPAYRHAGHYLGFCEEADPAARIERHLAGRGSPLVAAAVRAGGEVRLVRVWPDGDRALERRLKNGGSSTRLCPVCAPARLERRRAARNPARRRLGRGPDGRWRSEPS